MEWLIEPSKTQDYTVKLNGVYLYSKYNPKSAIKLFIQEEMADFDADKVVIVGLGLGYHIEELITYEQLTTIYVLYYDEQELSIFLQSALGSLSNHPAVKLIQIKHFQELSHTVQGKVMMPLPYLNALKQGKLDTQSQQIVSVLSQFKVSQMSSNSLGDLLLTNFNENQQFYKADIRIFENFGKNKLSVLVAAGPSLDDSIGFFKQYREKFYLLCVGSALEVLVKQDITPDAVIISDPQGIVTRQFSNVIYDGPLFFLSTAANNVVKNHKGPKYMLLQHGFSDAELLAKKSKLPLFETAGSVATAALSLLIYMNFEKYFFVGQDLCYKEKHTHAVQSSSNKNIEISSRVNQKVLTNAGLHATTTVPFLKFKAWFEYKINKEQIQVVNCALHGAKIEGANYMSFEELAKLLK